MGRATKTRAIKVEAGKFKPAKIVNDISRSVLIILIRLYQYVISPILPNSCRYLPSCSEYAVEAMRRHGCVKGVVLTAYRISRCHPWGGHGFDPVMRSSSGRGRDSERRRG